MIIRATFRNIFSFNEETSISFVAGKGTTKPEHVDRAEGRDDISILKAGVVYGANASGKSNLIKSISTIKKIVIEDLKKGMYKPFKLGNIIEGNSKIELEIKVGKEYYAYGIEYNYNSIQEEWLYLINKRTEQLIFERKWNEEKYEYIINKTSKDKDTIQFVNFIAEGTPKNTCFLKEYIKRNGRGVKSIAEVYSWFEKLEIIFPKSTYKGFYNLKDEEFNKEFNEILNYFNTGIKEVKQISVPISWLSIPKEIIEDLENNLGHNEFTVIGDSLVDSYYFEKDKNGKLKAYQLETIHKNNGSEGIRFDLTEESDGSIRLLEIIPMLIYISKTDRVFLIDELDRSMHTMLTKEIFRIYSKLLQKKNIQSQFICTTHESNLLSLESLREDEIWFAEKDETGSTHFTSLCEFEHRDNNKQKGYLNGRYGAIPFYGDINNIIND